MAKKTKTMNLNFGPQHPAAHGVLRLILELDGEVVEKIDPHIGLFIEELKNLLNIKLICKHVPYFDRLRLCSSNESRTCFCFGNRKTFKYRSANKRTIH